MRHLNISDVVVEEIDFTLQRLNLWDNCLEIATLKINDECDVNKNNDVYVTCKK